MGRMAGSLSGVLSALLPFLLIACNVSGQNGWERFVDPEAGFGIAYPAAWVMTSTRLPTASLAVNGTHAQKGLSCSLYHQRYPQLAGVETRVGLSAVSEARLVDALSRQFSQVALSPQPEATLADLPARVYQVTYQSGGGQPYMGKVWVTVANGGFYNLFCGAPVELFVAEGKLVKRIQNSLAILPVADG